MVNFKIYECVNNVSDLFVLLVEKKNQTNFIEKLCSFQIKLQYISTEYMKEWITNHCYLLTHVLFEMYKNVNEICK